MPSERAHWQYKRKPHEKMPRRPDIWISGYRPAHPDILAPAMSATCRPGCRVRCLAPRPTTQGDSYTLRWVGDNIPFH
jgi:hypothetical protein